MRDSKLDFAASEVTKDRKTNRSDDLHPGYSGESSEYELYRLIAEYSSEGIFLATEFELVYANPAFFRIIGITNPGERNKYHRDEIGDKKLLDLLDRKDAERILKDIQKALEGKLSEAHYEVKLKRPDGRWINLSLSMSKVVFKGKPHALGIIRDITDRKRMEQELRHYNELLKLTNSILRHDVLNNLNIISGAIELCENECLGEKAVRRCIDLIHEVRELEALTKESKKVSVRRMITEIARNYDIQVDVKGDCKAESFLSIVFDNLIRNSVSHGKASKIDVDIEEDSSKCMISFKDNGRGIPENIRLNIFEKGFKFGESANTGLGLFIARKIVEMLGGSIELVGANEFVIALG